MKTVIIYIVASIAAAGNAGGSHGYVFEGKWGKHGERPGEFGHLAHVALAADGTVYVVDSGKSRGELRGYLKGVYDIQRLLARVTSGRATPRDLAKLARALIKKFPEHYKWYSTKKFKFNKINQYNRNKLLWRNKFVDGIKTGHTDSAGYCLVASAKRDGMRLISVVLGTRSEEARSAESQKLLSYGFRFFETHKLYAANESLTSAHI